MRHRIFSTPGFIVLVSIVGFTALADEAVAQDCDNPSVTVTVDPESLPEGDADTQSVDFVIDVKVGNDMYCSWLLTYQTGGGTATPDVDYDSIPPTTPPECRSGNDIVEGSVGVFGDTEIEPDETFEVQALTFEDDCGDSTPIVVDERATVTVENDDLPTVLIDDVQVEEGDSGTTDAVFTVRAEPLAAEPIAVSFQSADATATVADGDYQAQSGSVTIMPVEPYEATITVPVAGDTRVEDDETFTLQLTGADGAEIADGEGVGTILNDEEEEEPGTVRIAAAPATSESAGTASVVVERLDPSVEPAQVTVSAQGGTATAGVDFTPVATVVSWAAEEGDTRSVQIPLIDDNLAEENETIRVTLSTPVGTTLGSPSAVDLVILDDEQEGEVEIVGESEPTGVVERTADLTVRVRRSDGTPIEGAQVFWQVTKGEAELTGGNPTRSDAEGISRQTVDTGQIPGIVTILATLTPPASGTAGGFSTQQEQTSVTFRLRVRGDLDLSSDADADPENLSVGGVLDFACIEPEENQFADFCRYLFGLGDADQRQVVEEATPREVAAQGNLMLELPQWNFRHVGRRLAALRGGGSRRAEEELAIVLGREEVKVAALVDTVRDAVARQARFDGAVNEALEAVSGAGQEDAGAGDGEQPQPRMDEELDTLPRLGVFASGRVATAERDGTDREEGFEAGIEGLTVGADYRLTSDLILGGALGYLTTDLDLLNDGGGLDADGYSLTAYGAWMREALYVEGVAGYGSTSFDLRRHVDLPVPFQGATRFVALGETDGTQWMANLGAGWEIAAGASSFELFARGSYVDAELDGYRERGGGPFDLEIRDQTLDSLLAEAGVSFGYAVSRDWGVLQPVVRAAALHEFGDDSRLVRGRFLGDVQQLEFVVPTDEPDRDFFNLGVGVTVTTYRGRSFYLFYDTDLARDDLEVGTFTLGARLEF